MNRRFNNNESLREESLWDADGFMIERNKKLEPSMIQVTSTENQNPSLDYDSATYLEAKVLEESRKMYLQEQMEIMHKIEYEHRKKTEKLKTSVVETELLDTLSYISQEEINKHGLNQNDIIEEQRKIMQDVYSSQALRNKGNSIDLIDCINQVGVQSQQKDEIMDQSAMIEPATSEINQDRGSSATNDISTFATITCNPIWEPYYHDRVISFEGDTQNPVDQKLRIKGTKHVAAAIETGSSAQVVICPCCHEYSKIVCHTRKLPKTKPLYCVRCGTVSPVELCLLPSQDISSRRQRFRTNP